MQQGDIALSQTADDGEFSIENGVTEMASGLYNFAYLCMFGGNQDDSGAADDVNQYWGNLLETDNTRKYRSEVQHLLGVLPASVNSLKRIKEASKRDLQPMITSGAARSIDVVVSNPTSNNIEIVVTINGDSILTFNENWQASL